MKGAGRMPGYCWGSVTHDDFFDGVNAVIQQEDDGIHPILAHGPDLICGALVAAIPLNQDDSPRRIGQSRSQSGRSSPTDHPRTVHRRGNLHRYPWNRHNNWQSRDTNRGHYARDGRRGRGATRAHTARWAGRGQV